MTPKIFGFYDWIIQFSSLSSWQRKQKSFSPKVPHNDYQSIVPQQSDVTNDTVTIEPSNSAGFLTEAEIGQVPFRPSGRHGILILGNGMEVTEDDKNVS